MTSAQLRAQSRANLNGRWLNAILATFLAGLFGSPVVGYATQMSSLFSGVSRHASESGWFSETSSDVFSNLSEKFGASSTFVSVLLLILALAVGGVISLGIVDFHQRLYRKERAPLSVVFSYFDRFKEAFLANLLIDLLVVIGTALFVVPGIILGFAYSQTFFLLQEDPSLAPVDALRRSRLLMRGHKWDLFLLELSFLGWYLLCAVTAGIGFIILEPYVLQAKTAFYNSIKNGATDTNRTQYKSYAAGPDHGQYYTDVD
ncbi:MAG: DUF975 family protein [Clostridia bacterium]|nr:DUF975 family protein [Clostridia bacterium]